jgi:hypothetical protein
VAHRPFEVAAVHPFDDHNRNADDLKTTNNPMLKYVCLELLTGAFGNPKPGGRARAA